MYQTFDVTAAPEQGPPRLAALRDRMKAAGLDGFIVPRADVHQGEYVAPCDARLEWLTGFTGSAGFAAILTTVAGVFVDGRYRTQVKAQVAPEFTPVPWPDVRLAEWLRDQIASGVIGYDPWLQTVAEMDRRRSALNGSGITLQPTDNLVDLLWTDRPPPPMEPVRPHPVEFAGRSSQDKRKALAQDLQSEKHDAAVLTQPDSIMWLLNIRGADIPRNPLAHGFAVLFADGSVDLYMAEAKLDAVTFDPDINLRAPEAFADGLAALRGRIRIDRQTVPEAVATILGDRAVFGPDPCALPKAIKNAAEIEGAAAAHLRDAAAMVTHLAWLDSQSPGSVTEIDVVKHLETSRRRDNSLQDISFDTIAGSGPNGAIMHYRVTEATNRTLDDGELLVLDSGGQYLDGTTDITRTIAIGTPPEDAREAFTRVLRGMIAMSRLHWPHGLAGRDIEAIGRVPLWEAGQDFNHGLGHGVGAYMCVHEGPQRLSKASTVPIEAGMILSNEPGYYREGAFGIRIENLIVAEEAPIPGQDPERAFLRWRTLTFVPIDRRLIVREALGRDELEWLNAYHAEVAARLTGKLDDAAAQWLKANTAPL